MVLQLMLPLLVGLINLLEYMINSVFRPAQHPSLVKHRRAAVISKYLAFINCLYMTLVRYTVGAFVCINLTADGTLMVLKADPNIECYSPTHNALMAVAVVGVVLYGHRLGGHQRGRLLDADGVGRRGKLFCRMQPRAS